MPWPGCASATSGWYCANAMLRRQGASSARTTVIAVLRKRSCSIFVSSNSIDRRCHASRTRFVRKESRCQHFTPSGDKRFKLLDAAMKKHQFQADALLEVLHTAQELFGFLQADLADVHRSSAEAAAEPRLRRGDVLSFFHVHAERQTQLQRVHGDGLLRQGSRGRAEALEKELGDQCRANTRRREGLALNRPLSRHVRSGARAVVFDGAVVGNLTPETAVEHVKGWVRMELAELQQIAEHERAQRKADRASAAARRRVASRPAASPSSKHSTARLPRKGLGDRVQACSVGCLRLCCAGPLVQVDPSQELYEEVKPEQVPSIVAISSGRAELGVCSRVQPPSAAIRAGHSSPSRCRSCWRTPESSNRSGSNRTSRPAAIRRCIMRSAKCRRPRSSTPLPAAACAAGAGRAIPPASNGAWSPRCRATAKYVVCNADEGDPGAFMDRSVLESDPHRVLEGMAIAAYAVGATQGYIYVRGEYPLAIHRLEVAIKQARKLGLLGRRHLRFAAQFSHRYAHRRRGLRLRRRDGADRIDRRQTRQPRLGRRIPPRKGCGIARR